MTSGATATPGASGEVEAQGPSGPGPLDAAAVEDLAQRHRRELHVHCYRMLASYDDADDAVQEVFLRLWRHRGRFDGRPELRAWLYQVATNVCLDLIRSRKRRVAHLESFAEVPWLQPYPDRLLDEVVADDAPDRDVTARETVELAFVAALQVLPARQRAAFVARDVLGRTAQETAELLDTTVPAANSAVQRARATMAGHLPSHRSEWGVAEPSAVERDLLARFIDAHERCDAAACVAIATRDLRITMPPQPMSFDGLAVIRPALEAAFGRDRDGDWRLVPTMANRMPTAASYLRRPGDTEFRAYKFDVLRVEVGAVAEITTFGVANFPRFGLPELLEE